jgi:hypothetical protein
MFLNLSAIFVLKKHKLESDVLFLGQPVQGVPPGDL